MSIRSIQHIFGKVRSMSQGYTAERAQPAPSDFPAHARVLSIQSHVVHGYVGNKAAIFPLQLLGFEVDPIMSVHFSNHTGYPKVKGTVLKGEELSDIVDGLKSNELHNYSHLLTGYIGSRTFLENVIQVYDTLKEKNPSVVYVCDPVLGDAGQLYVPKELIQVYKEKVIERATIITPNQFEMELLTDVKITNMETALSAIDILHTKFGIPIVVLSSADFEGDECINFIASRKTDGAESPERVKLRIDRLQGTFVGTGDLLSALFLAWVHKDGGDIASASEKTISTLQAVLKKTLAANTYEMQIIASKSEIENPPEPVYKATPC